MKNPKLSSPENCGGTRKLSSNGTLSIRVVKVAMASALVGILAFWLNSIFGINIHLGDSAGLVFGAGILLFAVGTGFGDRLKTWQIAAFSVVGSFLLAPRRSGSHPLILTA